ncbi:PREDICTED: F-box/FBD/LRR-repeat protein At1g13570-like [Fragaria vesca subsp. vesca]|uniref:F-box/FBD/LRR-repeat protein At1g13570-like n=1 Tax=Fragaria vesca subsp. vesca TaxID=101020 RepID=UPI0002C320CB|nr:PREDICTED: F-box/FBD/LRR-repeat protein At1g13570-like [Fragaria vesca subsp. vesca]
MEVELDRISNLPEEVIDKILTNLPIKDGARTSVLASNWRYKWAMLPHLVFDARCNSRIANQVLLGHFGPISKFELCQGSKDIRDIDGWILYLSRNHPVNDLKLSFSVRKRYKMPSCMFSCQDIIHLNLTGCLLKPPSTFEGFRSLRSLHFEDVILNQDVFDHMILSCNLLERLTLKDCGGFTQLKIDAPNLLILHCSGVCKDFSTVNALQLAYVYIDLFIPQVHHNSSNVLKFFHFFVSLPMVEGLHISWSFLNYLAAGALPKLHKPCLHLKFLDISMFFDYMEEVSIALCLLSSSPALEILNMEAMGCHNQADVGVVKSWLYKNRICSFTKLRFVKIQRISGVEAQLDFIRFLLISSPVLETMTVVFLPLEPNAADENPDLAVHQHYLDVVTKLLRFRRASPNLEIIYSQP